MLDLDAVPWDSRKCCVKDMRKAAQVIALLHMIFFGPVLFAMLYVQKNQHSTLFFGDNIKGPLPNELQLVLTTSLVVLGLRLASCFLLFTAEMRRSVVQLRLWMAAHLLLSLSECGLITALSTIVYVVDPDIEPFIGTLLGGFILLGLQGYAMHVVLCLHTGLMKERVLRNEVKRLQKHITTVAARLPQEHHPHIYATLSLSPQVIRNPARVAPWSGTSTPGANPATT